MCVLVHIKAVFESSFLIYERFASLHNKHETMFNPNEIKSHKNAQKRKTKNFTNEKLLAFTENDLAFSEATNDRFN